MDESTVRGLLDDHFAAAGKDEVAASAIYADDAVLDFPQGGERIRGKANILAMRSAYPADLGFERRRTTGSGDLWVNEYTISYDGHPNTSVSIMEFRDGLVVHETIYISEPWEPPEWRARWVEPITTEA
jgi:hypothetical protein